MATFKTKQNDLEPPIVAFLKDRTGATVVLAGTETINFYMRAADGSMKIAAGTGAINDAPTGEVQYAWVSGDTDTAGQFDAEFEVVAGGRPRTFPDDGYIVVDIEEDLGP